MKLILTGEPVTADEALSMGMLSEVVPDGTALEPCMELAETILRMPPLAVLAIKEVMRLGQDVPLETALAARTQSLSTALRYRRPEGRNAGVSGKEERSLLGLVGSRAGAPDRPHDF